MQHINLKGLRPQYVMDIHKAANPKIVPKRAKTTQNVQKLAENQGQGWPGWKDQWPEYDLVEKQVWRRHCWEVSTI